MLVGCVGCVGLIGSGYIWRKLIMERFLRYKDIAELFSIPVGTLRYWVFQRKIPHYKNGKCIRFRASEIQKWFKRVEIAS